jgi:hypothetical protein
MRSVNDEWPQDEVKVLIEMRAQGYTSPQIGVRIGRTAKAVISKARALKLPKSKSRSLTPFRSEPPPRPIPVAGKTTLPPLPSLTGLSEC